MGALTYALSQAASSGWGSVSVVSGLVAAAVLITGFVVIEAVSPQPLIPLAVFRPRGLRVANLLMLALGAMMTAAFFFLSLYLQQALGYSALRAGLALLPTAVIMVGGGLASRLLLAVTGPRLLLAGGGLITAGALAWLATAPARPAYLAHVLGPALLAGIGLSLMLVPLTIAGTAGARSEDSGAVAGVLNSSRQLGGALGLAVLVNLAVTATKNAVPHAGYLAALVHGYHVAFAASAVVMAAAALAALALQGGRHA